MRKKLQEFLARVRRDLEKPRAGIIVYGQPSHPQACCFYCGEPVVKGPYMLVQNTRKPHRESYAHPGCVPRLKAQD